MARKPNNTRAPSQRQLKVAEHIRHMLSTILQREDFHDPILKKTSVNISQVSMSPDLRHARIYIVPLAKDLMTSVVDALNRHGYAMRKMIAKNLTMRFLPKLNFVEDDLIDQVSKIEELLHSDHVAQDLKK